MHKLIPLIWVFAFAGAFASQEWDKFVESVLDTLKLNSPTIIGVKNEKFLEFCMKSQWALCLTNDMETSEVVEHLTIIHRHGKQDGILLIGDEGHKKLIEVLANLTPNESLFARNYPVLMPTAYKNDIKLRLDSNVIFYEESGMEGYQLYDLFAIKGGPPITLKFGKWNRATGLTLHTTMNRWDRRTDLRGASFTNVFTHAGNWASLKKDQNGVITGSEGYIQDMLFYITDNLNLTMKTLEVPGHNRLLKNGTWDGGMGLLQRKEADVCSRGLGLTLQRFDHIDFAIPTIHLQQGFLAPEPTGSVLDFWSFINVFGLPQWMTYISLLVMLSIGVLITNVKLCSKDISREFGTTAEKADMTFGSLSSASSSLTLVCLYAIQMGEHTDSKFLAPRILTLTLSILTLIIFGYYANDITADMTAGVEIGILTDGPFN